VGYLLYASHGYAPAVAAAFMALPLPRLRPALRGHGCLALGRPPGGVGDALHGFPFTFTRHFAFFLWRWTTFFAMRIGMPLRFCAPLSLSPFNVPSPAQHFLYHPLHF